jgi:eukaryotic-like serine/threonine-protein kinase
MGTNSSGQSFMLMKVIEGQTLREAILELHTKTARSHRNIRPLLEALVKVGEAIAYAHSQNVIHRDSKP